MTFDVRIQQHKPEITDRDRRRGYINRYFAAKANQINDRAYEVGLREFRGLKSNPYVVTAKTTWIIDGRLVDTYKWITIGTERQPVTIPGVISQNQANIKMVTKKIPAVKILLRDPTELYIEEITPDMLVEDPPPTRGSVVYGQSVTTSVTTVPDPNPPPEAPPAPPPPADLYRVDFSQLITGTPISNNSGWSVQGRDHDPNQFGVIEDAGALDGKLIRGAGNIRFPFLVWDNVPNMTEGELLARVRTNAPGNDTLGPMMRCSYDGSTYDYGIGMWGRTDQNSLNNGGYDGGGSIGGGGNTATGTLNADTWYWIRFRYTDSTGFWQGRMWEYGTSEPGVWHYELTNDVSGFVPPGTVGLFWGIFPPDGTADCDYLSVSQDINVDAPGPGDPADDIT